MEFFEFVTLLDCQGDDDADFCSEFKPPNKLQTLKFQAQDLKFRQLRSIRYSYRWRVYNACRYRHLKPTLEIIPKRKANPAEANYVPVEHPEVVLTVQVCRPREEQLLELYIRYNMYPTGFYVDHQFRVLGCQHLTALRDAIRCVSDAGIVGECSENHRSELSKTYQDIYKSGFFYINGTFYNDMRDPQNKDYSRPIIEWSKTARGVGPFSVAKMEETKFIDLEIQLGLPYLYQHEGYCEHLIVFSELRLVSSTDPQNVNDYPLTHVLRLRNPVRCMACKLYMAKWVTTEDERLYELPYFFCDRCFEAFNYDTEGKKIADFKAYKYIDKNSLS